MLEAGNFSGLGLILQNIFMGLVYSPFVFYFAVSFVVVFSFDILRTRESNQALPPRMDEPPRIM